MMNISTAFNAAQAVEAGTEPCEIARIISHLRGFNPDHFVQTPLGLIPQWKGIIIEMMLLPELAQAMSRG